MAEMSPSWVIASPRKWRHYCGPYVLRDAADAICKSLNYDLRLGFGYDYRVVQDGERWSVERKER